MLLLLLASPLSAATNDLSTLLQRGLFEEEANRNLDAAISSYESLAKQFDKDRQVAATAVFRLGECYRKLGKTNEAVLQYERIVRDFSDQPTLVTLSRQNLAGMGTAGLTKSGWSEIKAIGNPAAEAAEAEAISLQQELKQLQALTPEQRRVAVQQDYPNPVLTKLMQDLADAEQKLINLPTTYTPDHPLYKAAEESKKLIEQQIDKQVEGTLIELQVKLDSKNQMAKQLRAANGSAAPADTVASVTSDEDQEIRRIQAMIQNSPDLINSTTGGGTPLIEAASKGQVRVVSYLLDHGANINLKANGTTPLIAAVKSGNRSMADLLLNRGADVNATDATGGTALHTAAQQGFRSVAEVLLAHHADLNARNSGANSAHTPLGLAAISGRSEIIKLLAGAGTDLNLRSGNGSTPLEEAVDARQATAITTLLELKADPNLANDNGWTPLGLAALQNEPRVVDELLAHGANPNLGPRNRPLFGAIKNRSTNLVEQLLQAGADPNRSAQLDYRAYYGNGSGVRTNSPLQFGLDQPEMVQLLLKFKANPNGTPESGPLLFSALLNKESLPVLLDGGADPNVVETNQNRIGLVGETPLLVASRWTFKRAASGNGFSTFGGSDFAASQLLAAHGAKVNVRRPSDGMMPLHLAAESGSTETVELLLKSGAEVNARNNKGQTPLDLVKQRLARGPGLGIPTLSDAERVSFESIASLLRQNGARDDLPDFSVIRVTRQGLTQPITVFLRNTNDWNHFTLLETLFKFYSEHSPRMMGGFGPGPGLRVDPQSLAFPDLTRIIIHRPNPKADDKENVLTLNLIKGTNGLDCSKDLPLQFGDVIEIPIREYRLQEVPVGLTSEQFSQMADCEKRGVTVKVRDQTRTLAPSPAGAFLSQIIQLPEVQSLLLSSSDLSRVRVKRPQPGGQPKEFVVNVSANANSDADLWLRNGDVIEIPEK